MTKKLDKSNGERQWHVFRHSKHADIWLSLPTAVSALGRSSWQAAVVVWDDEIGGFCLCAPLSNDIQASAPRGAAWMESTNGKARTACRQKK